VKKYLSMILAALLALIAQAAVWEVSWDAPSERTDGTPLAAGEIAGYWLYDLSGDVPQRLMYSEAMTASVTVTVANVTASVAAVDVWGEEGEMSESVVLNRGAAPGRPVQIKAKRTK